MSDTENTEIQQVDELTLLKQRAATLGISFSNNIGAEKLKERINEKLNGTTQEVSKEDTEEVNALTGEPVKTKAQSKADFRNQIKKDAERLIRLRITNLDPKKSKWPGEIITVANEYIGTISKYVPFGEVTEDGYHVPNAIYKKLKKRKFLDIRVIKQRGKPDRVIERWVPEFALEVLPQLTEAQLKKLAATQAASGSLRD